MRAQADAPGFRVVANTAVAGQAVDADVLRQIFLKKVSRWGDGSAIVVADLSAASAVRGAFAEKVLGLPAEGIRHYWARQITQGVRPPVVKSSEAELLEFVATTPGAIGYVSAETALPESVKALDIQ